MYILIPVVVLGVIGLVAALILFVCSKKFAVKEDPRLGQVGEVLPQANCGGCGFPGCSGFAAACLKAADERHSLEGLNCPTGGANVMSSVGSILGLDAVAADPKVAVVRCNGTCEARPRIVEYVGMKTCKAMNACGIGETGCAFGCLGCGDCVAACQFDAIRINPETGIPEVDEDKCVACGACAKACPRGIIELRKKGKKGMRLWVQCMNKDKGAMAKKNCANACIGCGMCEKVCQFDAVHVVNNVAYIDPEKCKLCRKCESVCPQNAIHSNGFPKAVEKKKLSDLLPKPKPAAEGAAAAPAAKPVAAAPAEKPAAAPAAKPAAAVEKPAAAKPAVKVDYSVTEDPILRKIRMEKAQQQ